MTSPPWMPLSVDDYLADTGHLSTIEHGAYLLLILRYWKDRGLPNDEKMIARYARLTAEQWSESREVLVALFDEGWKHKRIEAELAKADEIISKRKSAGQQRHSKSSASAEQTGDISSYAGVPPSPEPLPESPPPTVFVAADGARDFDEVFEIFPRNPTSNRARAEAAFSAMKAADRASILAAARRFALWFAEDCAARKRTVEAGLKFAPHLATWLESEAWRDAPTLPVKADRSAVVMPMVKLDRDKHRDLWLACERIQGKKAPTSDWSWSFPSTIVEQARADLAAPPVSEEVH